MSTLCESRPRRSASAARNGADRGGEVARRQLLDDPGRIGVGEHHGAASHREDAGIALRRLRQDRDGAVGWQVPAGGNGVQDGSEIGPSTARRLAWE
jgi:hypothetical protein